MIRTALITFILALAPLWALANETVAPDQLTAAQAMARADGLAATGNWAGAAPLYAQAAVTNADAAFMLGHMHLMGRGVAADEVRAKALFAKAAALGHGPGSYWLAQLLENAAGEASEIRRLYRAAADTGLPEGALALLRYEVDDKKLLSRDDLSRFHEVLQTYWNGELLPEFSYMNDLEARLQRSFIRDVQQALLDAGHDPKGVDGAFGPNSRAALQAFMAAFDGSAGTAIDLQALAALGLLDGPV